MVLRPLVAVTMALCAACLFPGAFGAEQVESAAEILFPRDGATVGAVEEVRGRLPSEGVPILLVRPLPEDGQQPWYVQPSIRAVNDGTFVGQAFFGNRATKPGTRFRIVIVVERSQEEAARNFKPGATLDSLPPELPRSPFVTVARDGPGRPANKRQPRDRLITFADRPWAVKCGDGLGPGPNAFCDAEENVRVDADGHLRLALTERDGRWTCAEAIGEPLGFGEYVWCVSGKLAELDPNVVLGLFVYAAPDSDRREREVDFELSRWGDADNPNAQFVVQPHAAQEMRRFDTGKAEVITVSLTWGKGAVSGRCWAGEDTSRKPLGDWKYAGPKVPKPEEVRVRMNLWLLNGQPPINNRSQEVIIHSFHFQPAEGGKAH